MTDAVQTPPVAPTPKQQAQAEQAQRMAEEQAQIQHLEREIAKGKRMLSIACLNMANMTLGFAQEVAVNGPKGKGNPQTRKPTLADVDKVSVVLERLSNAVGQLSSAPMGMGPMGMMRGR